MTGTQSRTRPRPGPGATFGSIAYWILVGALSGLGIAGLMTIGILLLAAAAALFLIALFVPAVVKAALPAALIGVAAAPLFIAWLNRNGPGEYCRPDGCTEQWDPWPFATAGIVLMLIGAALTWYALRRPRI